MNSNIKLKHYFHNFAVSNQGDIYTWLPIPDPKLKNEFTHHLFPKLLSFKLPSDAQILGISTSIEKPEIVFVNSKNEVLRIYLFTSKASREKLILPLEGKTVDLIKISPDLDSILFLTTEQTTLFYTSNYSISKNTSEFLRKEYEEVPDLRYKFKEKINAAAVTNKGYAVVTDNKTLTLLGDISFYTKHSRSSAKKFTFDFNKNPKIKDLFFNERNLGFVSESNEIFYNSEPLELKKSINLSPRYSYKDFGFELSDLNNPKLNDHFIVSSNDQVYALDEKQELITTKPIKINLNLEEKIITIQNLVIEFNFRSKASAFALTNQGNLYAFGENNEFQLGVGSRSMDPIMDAIIVNPYLNKELDSDFFLSLVDAGIKNNDQISMFFKYIPHALKTSEELIIKLMISSDFDKNLNDFFEINYDLLLKFISIRPDLKYKFLNFDPYEFIDEKKLSSLSKIFPDIIFLYHEQELEVNSFETYLTPLLTPFKGKPISSKDINQLSQNLFPYDLISDKVINPLDELSINFHLALIKFGFQYDYINYGSLAVFVFNSEKKRAYFLGLPEIMKEKVQQSCEITELPKNVSMSDLVYDLVDLDLTILSERLITQGLIPKTKFLQLLAKSPKIFSTRFNSFLLATPKVVKSPKKNEFNFVGVNNIYSFEDETYFYDGDLLCLTGEEPEGLTNKRFARHRLPFFTHDYFNKVTNSKVTMFAANNNSFVFINEHHKIFIGGRILRFLELARPKQGEEIVGLFDISSRIKLNKDEVVKKLLMPTEKTIIFLTSQSRIIIVYKGNSCLIAKHRNQDEFTGQDITPFLTLKEKEFVKELVCIDDNNLIYFTNQNNLYLLRKEIITKIDILLDQGEDVNSIKLGEISLLVKTNKGRLFMSDIKIKETYKIQNWNESNYSSKPPHDLIVEPQPLVLDNIHFPLEKEEQVLNYDVFHQHAAMLTNQGRVFLWGNYAQGAFGTIRFKFTHILDLKFLKKEEKIVNICVGYQKTFLITDKNRLFAFGANRNGSLGDGTEVDRVEPLDITNKFKR